MTNEEFIALVKKNPIGIGCAVLSLAIGLTLYFRSGALPETEAILEQRTAEADRHAANIKNAAQLKEQFEQLAEANKEIDNRVVRASQLGLNNQYFFRLETETGVKLVDFRQGALATKAARATYSTVAFNVSVQGEMPQIVTFLRALESGAHFCRVTTATVNQASGASARKGLLTMSLTLDLLGLP